MIGNDIVDLIQADADSNWQRKGYLQKIFSKEEQEMILTAANPSLLVWLLWSMKESVYKIHSRAMNWNVFAPLKIVCTGLELKETFATGTLTCQHIKYYTKSCISKEFVHTVASKNFPMEQIRIDISCYHPEDQTFRNTAPATVSHHGRYLALAYL